MTTPVRDPIGRLEALDRELSALLGRPAAGTCTSARLCDQDQLIVCGILGGKDVGKSTLINALAGKQISQEEEEVGEGTSAPVAFVHQDDLPALENRFRSLDGGGPLPLRAVEHSQKAIRGLVLVDLPDIDSTFREHLQKSRRAIERMERVIWMVDPKKADDQADAELVRNVVHAHTNTFVVLNKFDLMLKDGLGERDGASFWEEQRQWFVKNVVTSIGLRGTERRSYLLSARFDSPAAFVAGISRQWGDEAPMTPVVEGHVKDLAERTTRNLSELRQELLTPLPDEHVRQIKADHRSAQVQARSKQLLEHFKVEEHVQHCEEALRVVGREFDRQFDREKYVSVVARRLWRMTPPATELAHKVMDRRILRWPELAVLYWPLAGLFRFISRRLIPGPASVKFSDSDLHRVGGRDLTDRAGAFCSGVKAGVPELPTPLAGKLGAVDHQTAARLIDRELHEHPQAFEADLVSSLTAASPGPGRMARGGLWFLLLWFPLLQPILLGLLELAATRSMHDALRAATTIVLALGAGALLKGLAAVVVVYCGILSIMYARTVRDVHEVIHPDLVREDDKAGIEERVDELLKEHLLRPLRDPIAAIAAKLVAVRDELMRLSSVA